MKHVIYCDTNGDIRAESESNQTTFEAFVANLEPTSIVFLEGEVMEENIPEQHRDVFPVILKSFQKTWATNRVLLAPREPRKVVSEPDTELVVEDAPTAAPKPKRTRKKKAV